MEKNEYYKMFKFENEYWWYRGLHELVLYYVDKLKKSKTHESELESLKIFDAGCGTGKMMEILENNKYGNVEGIDYSSEAISLCKQRGLGHAWLEDLNTWDSPTEAYDIIISNDVIYNSGVKNDMAVVKKFHRALKKEGILILNLPAFKVLRRKHDIAVFGKRRYRKKRTLRQLKAIGFTPVHASYRLLPFFFVILAQKHLVDCFHKGKIESDLKPLSPFFNSFLLWMNRLENKLITLGIPLTFGSSLFLVCKK
jgi:2-polyprenyl-3-methyl-5-hydroxy-6-metoxy-1,4-benzoquinol methylase